MKITVDVSDPLLAHARRLARRRGSTLRAVIEEGLRAVVSGQAHPSGYKLPDCAVGGRGPATALRDAPWADWRAAIYGKRE
jgi:hypothetical protein